MLEKIKQFREQKKYTRISRKVAKDKIETSSGYIIDFSENFLLLQEVDDFKLLGYVILPVKQIVKLRHNEADRYCHKIMIWEGESQKIGIDHKIDLSSWTSIFSSIKTTKLNVIVECEDPKIDTFTIGPIVKTGRKYVYIQYFNAAGFLETESTPVEYEDITRVNFQDRYIDIFSKYLRERK